jgi:outer membrane protein assembly factor BamB
MRTKLAATLLVLASCKSAPRDTAKPGAPTPGVDVTADILAMNRPDVGHPPIEFKPGNVAPRESPTATKTATGFEVQFASHASITTPTVYDGAVIVSGGFQSKELYAFEVQTGKPLWAIDLHDDGPSSPACEDDVCVVNTESCTIFALDPKTGKQLWSYWLGDPLTSAPAIAKGRVFASYPAATTSDGKPRPAGATHVLAAFELKTGKILWQKWLDSDVMSAPVAMGDQLYVTTFAGTLVKLDQTSGEIRLATRARATSAPVVTFRDNQENLYYTQRSIDDDHKTHESMVGRVGSEQRLLTESKDAVYLDNNYQSNTPYASFSGSSDLENGFVVMPESANASAAIKNIGVANVSSMQAYQGSRVLNVGRHNFSTMGDEVVAVRVDDGKTVWKTKLEGDLAQGGFLGTSPAAAGGSLILGTLAGKVLRLDQTTGKSLATYSAGGPIRSQPVVANGWIYVGTEDGRLVAIDTKDKRITGWPTWGGNAQRTAVAP